MFPFRLSSIFKSRWIAVFFVANVLWFADDMVDRKSADTATDTAAGNSADAAQVNELMASLPADQQRDLRTLETFER